MSNNPLPRILGGTIGIVGVLAMSWNFGIGLILFLVALGIIGFAYRTSRRNQEARKRVIPHEVPVEVPEQNQRRMQEFLGKPSVPEALVDNKELNLLKRTLYQAGKDVRAAVMIDNEDQPVVIVQDVLIQVIAIANAHALPIAELVKEIAQIYDKIFENVDEAFKRYPLDLDYLTMWLANKALTSVRKDADFGETIKKLLSET